MERRKANKLGLKMKYNKGQSRGEKKEIQTGERGDSGESVKERERDIRLDEKKEETKKSQEKAQRQLRHT